MNIPGWFNFENIYQGYVNHAEDGSHFVEVGTYLGLSTIRMAQMIQESGKNIKFDTVDNWSWIAPEHIPIYETPEGIFKKFLQNLEDYKVNHLVTVVALDSVAASTRYANNSLDFVFIDSSHTYDETIAEIDNWYLKIKKDGVIGGHDYDWAGVKQAVDELNSLRNNKVEFNGTSWLYQK